MLHAHLYDTATLVSYLLSENDIGPLLVKTCTAVLCLRYIPGGAPLLNPNPASEHAFPELRDNPHNVFETLEVCTTMLHKCNICLMVFRLLFAPRCCNACVDSTSSQENSQKYLGSCAEEDSRKRFSRIYYGIPAKDLFSSA